ncbi:MAG TPA: class I SAM-dependent methyltransferase [Candidatus Hydrogenedentes bacterium]|nr:class I SAM-dependent methyltransferase [Candidatus Hydrogenedentota bacterium]
MAKHVCPVWVGYLLANPVRRLFQDPSSILAPYVGNGMKVLDIGCAMGFFSLPLARLVAPDGKVLCVDLQEKMLRILERRARRAGLSEGIETHLCRQDSLCLDGLDKAVDFALIFAVIHEIPDVSNFFSELRRTLKANGRVLMAEPKGHVSKRGFAESIAVAERHGFQAVERPRISRSFAVILAKNQSVRLQDSAAELPTD